MQISILPEKVFAFVWRKPQFKKLLSYIKVQIKQYTIWLTAEAVRSDGIMASDRMKAIKFWILIRWQ